MSASDRDMAPRASAEAHRRREMVYTLFASWKGNKGHTISGKPDDLQKAIRVFVFRLASDAAHRGDNSLSYTLEQQNQFYRQFISQTRAQRFGPIAFVSPAEWKQQIDQLCEEYGWKWVDPVTMREAA